MPPIGQDIPVSERKLLASHRFEDAHPDSYPVVKHAYLFSKACVELQAGDEKDMVRMCFMFVPHPPCL